MGKKVLFASGTQKKITNIITNEVQAASFNNAVTQLQSKSIRSLKWDGRVTKLKSARGDSRNFYAYRIDHSRRLIFTENKETIFVHDVVDKATGKSISGNAFKSN